MSIGEVARAVGMSVHALRYYERENLLLTNVNRSSAGDRRYTESDVSWLRICFRFRQTGMPLAELRRFADLVRQGAGNELERLEILQRHKAHIEEQVAALEHAHEIIAWKTSVYSEHLRQGTATGLWNPALSPQLADDR